MIKSFLVVCIYFGSIFMGLELLIKMATKEVDTEMFKRAKCYGEFKWETKCNNCKFVDKCIDFTNRYSGGTKIKFKRVKRNK